MQLPNLQCYVKFAGEFPIAKSKFYYRNWEKKAERYEEREIESVESKNETINEIDSGDEEENDEFLQNLLKKRGRIVYV